jgi:dihydroflavonol-4-reductase
VARQLLAAGHRVRVLVRPTSDLAALAGLKVKTAEGDVLDRASLDRALTGVQAVVHAAALVSLRPRDRQRLYQVNVEGTRNLLAAAGARGLRVLHTSSVATTGYTATPTLRDESHFAGPDELRDYPYADSKRQAEALALQAAGGGADVVVLNPGLLLGPGDPTFSSTRPVRQFLRGELRVFLSGGIAFGDVRDVADAFVVALSRGRAGQRYLLGGQNNSYRELLEVLGRITGLPRAWPVPRPMAQYWGWMSELAGAFRPHPFEELTIANVKYASLYNYCTSDRAFAELDHRSRPFVDTLTDTVRDHLQRGAARASTAALLALVQREPMDSPMPGRTSVQ